MLKTFLLILILILELAWAFYSVSENQILDSSGRPVYLRGFALENGLFSVWNDAAQQLEMVTDSAVVSGSLTEKDIQEIKKLGANMARYLLNYEQFDPANPHYAQNQDAFEKHLTWFNKYQLPLIVNLHIPPGHSNTIRVKEDSIFESRENWNKFETFWRDFLQRYKDEEIIAGWEFFNEPQVPANLTVGQWQIQIEQFLDKMRSIDNRHIFFVCNPIAKVTNRLEDGTHQVDWSYIPLYKYTDSNLVYVIHFYEPLNFTHQGYSEYLPAGVKYPLKSFTYKEYVSSKEAKPSGKIKNGWQWYQSEIIIPPKEADYGTPYCAAAQGAGPVLFDNIEIREINSKGVCRKMDLPNPSFQPVLPGFPTKNGELYVLDRYLHWTNYYSEKYDPAADPAHKPIYKYITTDGVGDTYSILLDNRSQEIANWQTDPSLFWINPRPGFRYQIEGWIKNAQNGGHIGISWYRGNKIIYNREFLEKRIQANCQDFSKINKVPIMVTEFGSIGLAQEKDRQSWTKDVCEIFRKNNIHYTYWCWSQKHGWGIDFGLILKGPYSCSGEYYRYSKLLKTIGRELRQLP